MRKHIIDAEFEVISGPTPVRWQPARREPVNWPRYILPMVIGAVALFTVALGLSGADLDTRDAVAADAARQPSEVVIR